MVRHYLRSEMSLEFESLVQSGSNSSSYSCISPIHSFCHVTCMHHIVAYCLILIVLLVLSAVGSVLEDYREYPSEGQYQSAGLPGKQPHWSYWYNPLFSLLLSFTTFKTTTFQTVVCCGSWTISSAWPVIATVTRWNPLACAGVDWAMSVFPTLLCLLCLELCKVWFIWVMG